MEAIVRSSCLVPERMFTRIAYVFVYYACHCPCLLLIHPTFGSQVGARCLAMRSCSPESVHNTIISRYELIGDFARSFAGQGRSAQGGAAVARREKGQGLHKDQGGLYGTHTTVVACSHRLSPANAQEGRVSGGESDFKNAVYTFKQDTEAPQMHSIAQI